MGAINVLIVDPEALSGSVILWAIGGAVFGLFIGLGRDSLWTQIAGINSMIMILTFAAASFALPIDFAEVYRLMGIIIIAGFVMAWLTSYIVTRPLRQLEAAETRSQQLLADVSHELLTPLTVLQSNLRAILDDVHDPDKEQMLTLYSHTRQFNHLVDDLHDIAQARAHQLHLDKTGIDLIALVEQAGELFEPLAQEDGLALHLSTPEQMPVLLGDQNRLIQVMQNLLANGLRHARSRIDLRLWQEGKMACVEVADDGDGIAAEHLPYIIRRFYRTDSSRSQEMGGTGLGLAISEAFVEAHGGTITAVSEGLGQGTAVRFELPMMHQSS